MLHAPVPPRPPKKNGKKKKIRLEKIKKKACVAFLSRMVTSGRNVLKASRPTGALLTASGGRGGAWRGVAGRGGARRGVLCNTRLAV